MDSRLHGVSNEIELFVVEGISAAQTVAKLRNRELQAVIALQGKPLNVLSASRRRISESTFYDSLVRAICGLDWKVSHLLEARQPRGYRFGRVILMFDPDADGVHCSLLALAFFFRFFPELIEEGRLSIARAPLYELFTLPRNRNHNHSLQTITRRWLAYTEQQAASLMRDFKLADLETAERRYNRGLANIPADTLASECICSDTRRVWKLSLAEVKKMLRTFFPSQTF